MKKYNSSATPDMRHSWAHVPNRNDLSFRETNSNIGVGTHRGIEIGVIDCEELAGKNGVVTVRHRNIDFI